MLVSVDLVWLVVFLNSNQGKWKDNEQEKQIPFLGGCFPPHFTFTKEGEDTLNRIRAEIIEVIEPLIRVKPSVGPLGVVNNLLQKINAVGLRPAWYVEPAEGEWRLRQGSQVITKGYRVAQVGPERGILKIGKQKLAVRHVFDDKQLDTAKRDVVDYLRRAYFATIITALEDGNFTRLGRCHENRSALVPSVCRAPFWAGISRQLVGGAELYDSRTVCFTLPRPGFEGRTAHYE